jgi:6-phosphogluconolactonase
MNRRTVRAAILLAAVVSSAALVLPAGAAQRAVDEYLLYFGTYTRTTSKGIYAYRFQPSTGKLVPLGLAADTPHPSFVAAHPNGRFLYAVNEHEGEDTPGKNNTVSAFAIDQGTGALTFLNKVSSRGEGPCHISVDKTAKTLLVANFRSGSVAALPIRPDGRLGEATAFDQHQGVSVHTGRQFGTHAHFVAPTADNRFVLATDLGLDQVIVYRLDPSKGSLTLNDPPFARLPSGSGPRHLAFHPRAPYVYVNGETDSTVSTLAFDAKSGTLKTTHTVSTLPKGFSATNTTAEIQVDPAGRYVYVSNRGHDSIAILRIDPANGALELIGHAPTSGKTPRYFTFDPAGAYLLVGNQGSDTVVVYRVDANSGSLTAVQTLTDVPEPASIVFVPVTR